jgi:glycosyltransferase involved in cell wall biosynthesis
VVQTLYFIDISLFFITIATTIIYVALLYNLLNSWTDTDEHEISENFKPQSKISIIIAARNEEKYLRQCIESILFCNYPEELYEIIIINDHSDDNTEAIVRQFQDKNVILHNLEKGAGKKMALELGITNAKGELIACTDADCQVPRGWLRSIAHKYENWDCKCIAGPISYFHDNSLIQKFQYLDSLNNMCVTAYGIKHDSFYMANGANLVFSKDVFQEIGGYSNNKNYASGDDMFMIQEIAKKYPGKVSFLKSQEAIVKTHPETNFTDLANQRARWATKSKAYTNKNIIRIQGFVFFFVVIIIFNLIFLPFGTGLSLYGFAFAILVKWIIDWVYLRKLAGYFGDKDAMSSFPISSILFMAYILYTGYKALFPSKYFWKGRTTQ